MIPCRKASSTTHQNAHDETRGSIWPSAYMRLLRKIAGVAGSAKLTLLSFFITAWRATWKASMSCWLPTVMRVQLGHAGQLRPMNTLRAAIESMTSFAGRLVSSLNQLDPEGTKEWPWLPSQSNVLWRISAL